MALVMTNNGELIALTYLTNKSGSTENLVYRLFTNNITPSETDTAATYTEASGSGYVAIPATGASWTITPGSPTTAVYPQMTYTFTGALPTIYGYYVTRQSTGDLVLAETFTSFTPTNNGDNLKLTPQITAE
jgi:hypothetical protein